MPKEVLLFDAKTPKQEPLIPNINIQNQPLMDIIPEIDDEKVLKNEQLLLKSPRIKIPSDIEEEKLLPNMNIIPKKIGNKTVDEEDVITEEKESENVYEAEEFKNKRIKNKNIKQFQNFIDKEEPPVDLPKTNIIIDNQISLSEYKDEETIKEDKDEDEGDVENKDFQKLRKINKKEVIVDEIDEDQPKTGRVRTIFSNIQGEEVINELDEFNNINNC